MRSHEQPKLLSLQQNDDCKLPTPLVVRQNRPPRVKHIQYMEARLLDCFSNIFIRLIRYNADNVIINVPAGSSVDAILKLREQDVSLKPES